MEESRGGTMTAGITSTNWNLINIMDEMVSEINKEINFIRVCNR